MVHDLWKPIILTALIYARQLNLLASWNSAQWKVECLIIYNLIPSGDKKRDPVISAD